MSELNDDNFSRIYKINWLICGPLLVMFAWPYYLLSIYFSPALYSLAGSFFFSLTFTLTVIHGHIAIALGTFHIDTYYDWHKRTMRLPWINFHPLVFTTRFRLLCLAISIVMLIGGVLLHRL